jgi:two-component system NarL family sensor kinase
VRSGRSGLDGRSSAARVGALARLAFAPLTLLFEALEPPHAAPDLWFGEPLLAVLVVYAVLSAIYVFTTSRDVALWPFAVTDTVLLSALVCAEGGAATDLRYMLFVPVLVAVLTGPRLTLGIAALSVVGFVAAAVAHPGFGADVGARLLAVHSLDIAARAGLAVVVAVLLTRRSERIRELAESRRSLVTQALGAEARARRELSYALHDELVQELLVAQQDLKEARHGRPEYLDRAQAALGGAVERLRHEIFQLHPHLLETAGLEAALEAVAAKQWRGEEPPLIAVAPEATGVDDELLFSLGRELLTNAARHADAVHVELTIERTRDRIELRCRDDGRGVEPEVRAAALGDGHLGLAACTERVEALGGTLEIESGPGRGTEVRASIPDRRRAATTPALAAPAERRPYRGGLDFGAVHPGISSSGVGSG